jgi:hypothetical protein
MTLPPLMPGLRKPQSFAYGYENRSQLSELGYSKSAPGAHNAQVPSEPILARVFWARSNPSFEHALALCTRPP